MSLNKIPYFVEPRGPRIGADVDDIKPVADQTSEDKFVAFLRRVSIATGAAVPATMMQLVVGVGHLATVNYLCGICQIVFHQKYEHECDNCSAP